MEKNEAQISSFAVMKKAPSLSKKLFCKTNPSSLFVQITPTKRCVDFLKNKWVSRYLTFGDYSVPKNFSLP